MKYKVWCLDVWGNKEDGYTVNDRHEIGEIELSEVPEDDEILNTLCDAKMISPYKELNRIELEVLDQYPNYAIDYAEKPQLELTCEDKALLDACKGV